MVLGMHGDCNAIAVTCRPREVKTVDFVSPHQVYLGDTTDPLSKLAVADYMHSNPEVCPNAPEKVASRGKK